jgi:acylphosphatase
VQGVWYRASAKDQALALGLTGKIWNDVDNTVSAVVQGPEGKIMSFVTWCKKGPPLAKVEDVKYEETPWILSLKVLRFREGLDYLK